MDLKKRSSIIIYVGVIIFSLIFIIAGNKFIYQKLNYNFTQNTGIPESARVLEITDTKTESFELGEGNTVKTEMIFFKAEILSGENKGQVVDAMQTIDGVLPVPQDVVQKGNKILIYNVDSTEIGQDVEWVFGDYNRINTLTILIVAFLALLVVFGRKKGVNTIVSLILTCLAIFLVFIPAILAGFNIYATSIIVSIYIIIMTFLIVNGADKKSLSAAAGCIGGVAVAGILTVIMNGLLKLTGAVDQDSIYLMFVNSEKTIDLIGIIFGAIVIGALGAIMDVSMSISSSLTELCEKVPDITFKSVISSGFNIGRDIMGTMANTLILAYIGSSLSVVLLLVAYNSSLLSLLNREMIAIEILQAIAGSMGILFTIPITSLISAYVNTRKTNKTNKNIV